MSTAVNMTENMITVTLESDVLYKHGTILLVRTSALSLALVHP